MGFKQIRNFNPRAMGTRQGYCLQNARLGFGISSGTYPSAKADMQAQKKNGTFHAGNPPTSIAVPVYCDTASKFEHVVVSDHGTVYSDGKRIQNGLKAYSVFGWGECCDGKRVVEPINEPGEGFLPPRGYWRKGDTDPRVGRLAAFMRATFPAYTPAAALGNYYGANLYGAIKEFQRRSGMAAKDCDGNTGPITYKKLQSFGFKG